MGNRKNLPQHGTTNLALSLTPYEFTEKKLRRPPPRIISSLFGPNTLGRNKTAIPDGDREHDGEQFWGTHKILYVSHLHRMFPVFPRFLVLTAFIGFKATSLPHRSRTLTERTDQGREGK